MVVVAVEETVIAINAASLVIYREIAGKLNNLDFNFKFRIKTNRFKCFV